MNTALCGTRASVQAIPRRRTVNSSPYLGSSDLPVSVGSAQHVAQVGHKGLEILSVGMQDLVLLQEVVLQLAQSVALDGFSNPSGGGKEVENK